MSKRRNKISKWQARQKQAPQARTSFVAVGGPLNHSPDDQNRRLKILRTFHRELLEGLADREQSIQVWKNLCSERPGMKMSVCKLGIHVLEMTADFKEISSEKQNQIQPN